ncbi:hypothetical protein PIB30_104669, partial [Stylosanthes scabra]|nr:hypothetical protein [Stylosanthes scabra]
MAPRGRSRRPARGDSRGEQADEVGPDAQARQAPQEEEDLHRLNREWHIIAGELPRFVTQHSKSYHILWTNFTNFSDNTTDDSIFGEARPNTPEGMLRQLSKLEPVPEKSEIYGVRIPNPWIL